MDMIFAYVLEETGGARPTGHILRKERGDCTKKRKQRLQERVSIQKISCYCRITLEVPSVACACEYKSL